MMPEGERGKVVTPVYATSDPSIIKTKPPIVFLGSRGMCM